MNFVIISLKELDNSKIFALQILLVSRLIDEDKLLKILEDNMINLENNPAIEFFEQKGIEKGKLEVVKKLFQKGFAINEISDMVNMPIEWIENKLNLI